MSGAVQVNMKVYADLQHSASVEELEDVVAWLRGKLPPLPPKL